MPKSSPTLYRDPDRLAASDRVAGALSLAIHEHRLLPGTKLGEDEIGEVYGVSRTIVRAALQRLAHIQLVEMQRNRGAFVAQPSQQEAREVFETRELLEPRTAHKAATLATDADVYRLREHIALEHAAMDAGDRGRALHLSGLFHIDIAGIAAQATIAGFIETLIARSSLIIALYSRRDSALCDSHAHHALIEAIAEGDGQHAEELMRNHLLELHEALDLHQCAAPPRSLKDALLSRES
ncbi:hypothetical protein P775_24435 [Puniceibacterium antarcticum]|uniref:HTH gntR-type domain-containing protein n=1 Tax=Puniceibacterium antarcticum TaxID=1206336 RepID=A0A2G8R749_9RHOB|nr:GntR family transcriptional regulator [Puniceibacterium antarcticum]PIL17353.1 hypothetical protein P775_24435 [Puniceibacterium antarcticum]